MTENVERLLGLVEDAGSQGCRLIVCPEMATCGYCFRDREEVVPFVETVPGELTDRLANLAQRFGCVIVCGLAEVDESTGLFYNTAVLVGPDGYLGKYRKVHFFASDAKWAVEGDLGFPVWNTPAGRIGIEVCMDATYPESGRLLALAGAQVICYPTNWVGRSSTPDHRWLAQAFENGVYWIAANRSDEERGLPFTGNTCILNPDGRIQAVCSGGEGIVYGEIDLDRTNPRSFDEAQVEEKLLDRRPDLYRPVLQNTYGWSPTYFQRLYGSPGLPAPRTSRVAALQLPPAREKPERAIQYIRRLLGAEAVDLLVLPELALTGAPDGAETSWDDALSALVDLAREREVLIVTSVFEPEGARRYNTVVLVGGKGLLARQRKHRLTRDDRSWATPGDQTPAPVDTPLGRLGLIGGYDALFWETLRVLACADIICIPAALRWPEAIPLPANRGTWIYWRAKAWESCAALAVANYPVPDFAGESGVFVPDVREDRSREAVAGVEGERLVCLAVDTGSRYIREKRSLSWRHLHLYTPLVVPHDVQIRRVPPRRPRAASG